MVGEDKFGHGFAGAHHTGRICAHNHAFHDLGGAGRGQVAPSLNFHNANSARSRGVLHACALEVHVAQRGYLYADGGGGVKDACSLGHAHGPAIYSKGNHSSIFHSVLLLDNFNGSELAP